MSITIVLILVLGKIMVPSANIANASSTVTISTSNVINSGFVGVGGEYDPFQFMPESINCATNPYGEAYWEVEKLRVKRMGVKVARMWFHPDWFMDSWSSADYDWNSEKMQSVYRFLDAAKEANVYVEFDFGWKVSRDSWDWFCFPGLTYPKNSAPYDNAAFAEACGACMEKLIVDMGYDNIKYLTFYNEPNQSDYEGPADQKAYYAEMLQLAHNELVSRGLRSQLEIWAPETGNADESGAREWFDYMTENADSYIDRYSFHKYRDDPTDYDTYVNQRRSYTDPIGKSVAITEMGDKTESDRNHANYGVYVGRSIINVVNSGVKSALWWRLCDQYLVNPSDGLTITGDQALYNGLHKWGFWYWLPDDLNPRPAYYALSLLTRYVERGSDVMSTSNGGDSNIELTAFKKDGNYTVVVVNTSSSQKSVTYSFSSLVDKTFSRHVYNPATITTEPNAMLISPDKSIYAGNSFTDDSVPANSMVVYTTYTPELQVQVTPSKVGVSKGENYQFDANIVDGTGDVTWSVVGGTENGTIDSSGLYTAPTDTTYESIYAVKATSTADSSKYGIAIVKIEKPSIIIDNDDSGFEVVSGTWSTSTTRPNYYETSYSWNDTGTGTDIVRWRPDLPADGSYTVYYWLPEGNADRPTDAPFTVYYNGGSQTYHVDEKNESGGTWVELGTHNFVSGASGYVELTDDCSGLYVIADAVKFEQNDGSPTPTPTPAETIIDNDDSGFEVVSGTWSTSTTRPNYYETSYSWNDTGTGTDIVRWRPNLPADGSYTVYYWLPEGHTDRPTDAPFKVYYNGGSQTYYVDEKNTSGGTWVELGTHNFVSGTSGYVELTDDCSGLYVIADAVKFVEN
jgi:hypothetical protein